jgi:hypothetical protein
VSRATYSGSETLARLCRSRTGLTRSCRPTPGMPSHPSRRADHKVPLGAHGDQSMPRLPGLQNGLVIRSRGANRAAGQLRPLWATATMVWLFQRPSAPGREDASNLAGELTWPVPTQAAVNGVDGRRGQGNSSATPLPAQICCRSAVVAAACIAYIDCHQPAQQPRRRRHTSPEVSLRPCIDSLFDGCHWLGNARAGNSWGQWNLIDLTMWTGQGAPEFVGVSRCVQ